MVELHTATGVTQIASLVLLILLPGFLNWLSLSWLGCLLKLMSHRGQRRAKHVVPNSFQYLGQHDQDVKHWGLITCLYFSAGSLCVFTLWGSITLIAQRLRGHFPDLYCLVITTKVGMDNVAAQEACCSSITIPRRRANPPSGSQCTR